MTDAEPPPPVVADKPKKRRAGGSDVPDIEVALEVSRQRFAGWTVFGLVVGTLLVLKLGTVGVWAGYVLIAVGLIRGYQLVMTFVSAPGTIIVSEREVQLPRGVCAGKPVIATPKDITAVYFLRKSVPWNRTAPMLVVELGARAMVYPRDWFASEADQRHVVHALAKYTTAAPATDDAA